MLLMLLACSSSSSEGDDPQPRGKSQFKIYVFAPDHPMVTRGDGSEIDASDEENAIHNLYVWVFEHDSHKAVGHVFLGDVSLSETGSEVMMDIINDEFADTDPKPNVDVFVAANVTPDNCGLLLDVNQTWDDLNESIIGSNYFSAQPSYQVTSVPDDGLPMSGRLTDKSVSGTSPVFRVSEDGGQLANVKLVRTVSKMRFVFCQSSTNTDNVMIDKIGLDENVLPTEEFLFLENAYSEDLKKCRVNDSYEAAATLITPSEGTVISRNDSPAYYSYDPSRFATSLEYEMTINEGIAEDKLTSLGTIYLRESSEALKLKGSIDYHINGVSKTKTFEMTDVGDFTRNHTWIVFGYFVTSGDLEVNVVEVKDWVDTEQGQEIYNW